MSNRELSVRSKRNLMNLGYLVKSGMLCSDYDGPPRPWPLTLPPFLPIPLAVLLVPAVDGPLAVPLTPPCPPTPT